VLFRSGQVITGKRSLKGEIVLIRFKNCTVKHFDKILFKPEWGIYDMAIGMEIVSAYNGPADPTSFDMITHIPSEQTIKVELSQEEANLEKLYRNVRDHREGTNSHQSLREVFDTLQNDHPKDWLLTLELYESSADDLLLGSKILEYLNKQKIENPQVKHLIENGINLIETKESVAIS